MRIVKTLAISLLFVCPAAAAFGQACDPVTPPKGWRAMLYGAGQAGMKHSGLPTDQEIQQARCAQALAAQQLEMQR
jgi:hypothetical protein